MKDKSLSKYLFWAFALAWALQIPASLLALRGNALAFQGLTALTMFAPFAALLLARVPLGSLGWRLNLRGNVLRYLAAWLAPLVLTVLGAALYFLIFPASFDGAGASYLALLPEESLRELEAQGISPGFLIGVQFVAAISYAPLLNTFLALGEETGWRGFLYPRLKERFGVARGRLLGGVIWGVWHWPLMILAGYEYGLAYWGAPLLGPPLFCIFTISCGVLLDWLYEKTGSVWAPSLAHGAVNAAAGLPMLFLVPAYADRLTLGPAPIGVIGGAPLLLLAALVLFKGRGEQRAE